MRFAFCRSKDTGNDRFFPENGAVRNGNACALQEFCRFRQVNRLPCGPAQGGTHPQAQTGNSRMDALAVEHAAFSRRLPACRAMNRTDTRQTRIREAFHASLLGSPALRLFGTPAGGTGMELCGERSMSVRHARTAWLRAFPEARWLIPVRCRAAA